MEEAAGVLIKIFEDQDEAARKELATRADLREMELKLTADIRETELRLEAKMAENKTELVRWMVGLLMAQSAFIIAAMKLFSK